MIIRMIMISAIAMIPSVVQTSSSFGGPQIGSGAALDQDDNWCQIMADTIGMPLVVGERVRQI